MIYKKMQNLFHITNPKYIEICACKFTRFYSNKNLSQEPIPRLNIGDDYSQINFGYNMKCQKMSEISYSPTLPRYIDILFYHSWNPL